MTLEGGGGGGVQARDVIRCTDQKNGGRTPATFDINDVMRGGGGWGVGGVIMKRQNDVNFSEIVWRRPLNLKLLNILSL